MLRSKGFWYFMMLGSLAGWAFAVKGKVQPFENEGMKKAWKNVFFGWVLGHPLELALALPIGKSAGLSSMRIVLKTMLFGFTWWVPVFLKVFKK